MSRPNETDAAARRAIAGAVWAVSWGLAIASLVIAWVAHLPSEPLPGVFLSQAPIEMRARFDDIGVTVALIYGPVSALILARRPHPVGVILATHAVGSGIAAFGVQYGLLGAQIPDLPLWGLVAFAAGWGFVPGTFMTAALPLLVMRGRVPRWQRAVVWGCFLVASAAFVVSLTQQSVPSPVNPLAIEVPAYQDVLPGLYTALSFIAVAISFVSCGVLIARWSRARGRTRVGIGWLALGQIFLTLSYLALVLPDGLDLPGWIVDVGLVAPVLGQILYPAAILVVVLGQRLWGVELVVSRVLLWSLLSLSGVGLYLLVIVVVPVAFPGADGLAVVAPVVIAVAVLPLRSWLQRRIDRLIYGEGADSGRLLARLADHIGELPPGAAGLTQLADTLRRVLRLGWVEIRGAELAAESGRRSDAATTTTHGALAVQPVGGQRLDRRTQAVLADVAGLVATVVRLAESYLVLDAARRDLVTRRADERRTVRRELHDGLGPALAGVSYGLAAVENLVPQHPDRARALLAELADDVHRRARDVRDLAGEVSAPQLEAVELPGALRRLAARFDSPGLRVRATIRRALARDDPDPVCGDRAVELLDAGTADTLYFVAAEALANAVRHARATSVDVRIVVAGTDATLEVVDDGTGIPPRTPPGIGMASMRERVAAHGGEVDVVTGPRGTAVCARVPLARTATMDTSRDGEDEGWLARTN